MHYARMPVGSKAAGHTKKKSSNILERTAVCKTNIIGVLFQKCDPPAKFPLATKSGKFKTTSSIA